MSLFKRKKKCVILVCFANIRLHAKCIYSLYVLNIKYSNNLRIYYMVKEMTQKINVLRYPEITILGVRY